MLGDSLTQFGYEGWAGDLADRYQRRADVLNRGMSGYNTRWFLRHAAAGTTTGGIWGEAGAVALVTIWFGANDAATLDQNVPLGEYRTNLAALVARSREAYPDAGILLITPPPVAENQRIAYHKAELRGGEIGTTTTTYESAVADGTVAVRTNGTTGSYAAACKAVAAESGVPCLDLFSVFTEAAAKAAKAKAGETSGGGGDDGGLEGFFTDGLHFGPEGHAVVAKALTETIGREFPDLAVRPCPVTGQFNNSGSACGSNLLTSSGPYHDDIKRAQQKKRDWREAFAATATTE